MNPKFIDATRVPYVSKNWLSCQDVEILEEFEETGPVPNLSTNLTGTVVIDTPVLTGLGSSAAVKNRKTMMIEPDHAEIANIEAAIKEAKEAIIVVVNAGYGNTRFIFDLIHKIHVAFPGYVSIVSPPVGTVVGVTHMIEAGAQAIQIDSPAMITALMHGRMAINASRSNATLLASPTNDKHANLAKYIAAGANAAIGNFANQVHELRSKMARIGAKNIKQFMDNSMFMELSSGSK